MSKKGGNQTGKAAPKAADGEQGSEEQIVLPQRVTEVHVHSPTPTWSRPLYGRNAYQPSEVRSVDDDGQQVLPGRSTSPAAQSADDAGCGDGLSNGLPAPGRSPGA
jgi:hypothetical protein